MAGSDLVVSVGANIQQLDRQMKAAAAVSEKAANDIEARFKKVNPTIQTSALTGALKGFAAAFTVDRIIRGLAEANDSLVRMGETAKRTGLDLQRFQELQFAGRVNGLNQKTFGSGLEGLAEKLNEARQAENALTKLFSDNNVQLKDRKGNVIGINDALNQTANLVRNAATEFDKIKIAEAVGLTKEWVPLLEQGASAIEKQASAARAAGVIIDSDIIQRAKEFERDWAAAIERWAAIFKANAGGVIAVIDAVIGKAAALAGSLDNYAKKTLALEDIGKNGFSGASQDSVRFAARQFREKGAPLPRSLADREDYFVDQQRESARLGAFAGAKSRKQFEAEERAAAAARRTNTSSLFDKGGGGGSGGGKSEEEQAQQRLDRYIDSLTRQTAVLKAENDAFFKSNAEKRAAVEIAKAQLDLSRLDEGARQKTISRLREEVAASEAAREQQERLNASKKAYNDASNFFGDAAVDALDQLILRGGKAEDVMRNLTQALAKAAIQAALMGTGPLAGIFGTTGQNGATGGLFGMFGSMFGRATGGGVNAGQAYRVGERGPETFVPTTPGRIIPNGRGGGLRVIINNSASNQVQASAERQPNGDLTVMVSALEAHMAQNAVRGKGSFAPALGAIRDGRQLRG